MMREDARTRWIGCKEEGNTSERDGPDNPVHEDVDSTSISDVENNSDSTANVPHGGDENQDANSAQQDESGVEEEGNISERDSPDNPIHEDVDSTSISDVENNSDSTANVPHGGDDNQDGSTQQDGSSVVEESNTSNDSDNKSDDTNGGTNSDVDENNNIISDKGSNVSSAVDVSSSESEDVNSKKGKRDINFLDGPNKQRLYMDEYSSVKDKIAGHQSAIDVEEESHERSKVKRRGKTKDE